MSEEGEQIGNRTHEMRSVDRAPARHIYLSRPIVLRTNNRDISGGTLSPIIRPATAICSGKTWLCCMNNLRIAPVCF
ncbi:hypothetical protein H6G17_31490 [Chroococcidiopsis sp. FACHB-1243]|uniref:hypothetical protein n=1 Tax=Chroococcidiopsis sp. [FACHB-1243] TaxID=2692781 RepID=UPI00177DD58E|nr:hypothetical protein [Chroococcidiopsis sp. [FACHB-1243]]MBD2309931.1 hypothetical protein [Chroococcidiopsis sp. [FACHB-1243]]